MVREYLELQGPNSSPIRKFTHDPRVYSRPDEFRPERFLASANGGVIEQDPRELCFGFGRRSVS